MEEEEVAIYDDYEDLGDVDDHEDYDDYDEVDDNLVDPCPPQLLQAYDDFHAKYPDGEINKEQFMEVSKVTVLKMVIWVSADNHVNDDIVENDGVGDDYDKDDIDSGDGGGGDNEDDNDDKWWWQWWRRLASSPNLCSVCSTKTTAGLSASTSLHRCSL